MTIEQQELNRMALLGWEQELQKINEKIRELKNQLKIISIREGTIHEPKVRKPISARALANMRKGQRKRWKEYNRLKRNVA